MKLEDFLSGQPGVKYLECVTHHVGGRGGQIERQEASHGTSGPRQSRKPDEPEPNGCPDDWWEQTTEEKARDGRILMGVA